MKKILGIMVGLAIFVSSAHAAIKIEIAEVINGNAHIKGKINNAQNPAQVKWEGALITATNGSGGFNFTGVLPTDCIGLLSVGTETGDVAVLGCTPPTPTPEPTGGVLKTGQTTCYDPADTSLPIATIDCAGTGQDGELQKGTARSYTVNAATITDNATGLEWEKLCNDTVNSGCPVINDVDTFYTWAQAFQKVADLNTAIFAGHDDWRLPNVNELQTLADYGKVSSPAIDLVFNNGTNSFTRSTIYWSSTTYQFFPSQVWVVSFNVGFVLANGKSDNFYVRAVRGGS